jgi:hypothetical protein
VSNRAAGRRRNIAQHGQTFRAEASAKRVTRPTKHVPPKKVSRESPRSGERSSATVGGLSRGNVRTRGRISRGFRGVQTELFNEWPGTGPQGSPGLRVAHDFPAFRTKRHQPRPPLLTFRVEQSKGPADSATRVEILDGVVEGPVPAPYQTLSVGRTHPFSGGGLRGNFDGSRAPGCECAPRIRGGSP